MAILAFENPTYQPAMRIIIQITQANPAVITTTFDHDYLSGTIVRLYIPDGYGMRQADKHVGIIDVTSSTTFTIDLDTQRFDAFTIPATFPDSFQHAQVVPVGQINELLGLATQNVLT